MFYWENLGIASAYWSIALEVAIFSVLAYRKLPQIQVWLPPVSLLGAFVFSCSLGHWAEAIGSAWMLPIHQITATVSWLAAIVFAFYIPQSLAIVDSTQEASKANKDLEILFDASIQGVVVMAPIRVDGIIVDFEYKLVNSSAIAVLKRDVTQNTFLENFPGQRDNLFLDYCQVLETGIPQKKETKATVGDLDRWWAIAASAWSSDRLLVCFSEITDHVQQKQQLKEYALTDDLTGLYGRRILNQIEIGEYTAMLYIDLNRFKQINDSLGHLIGDEVLRVTANRIQGIVKVIDLVARIGGDEFVVLLKDVDECLATQIADRLAQKLEEPIRIDHHILEVSGSIGVAVDRDATLNELLDRADIAMYDAKARIKAGRFGFVSLFQPSMQVARRVETIVETELKYAIADSDGHSLLLHYQPIFDLQHPLLSANTTTALIGFEGLVRWHHPQKGLIYPGDFIKVAEQTGLINKLFDRVFKMACDQRVVWDVYHRDLKIAVNISAIQLTQQGFPMLIYRMLKASGVDARQIQLEITEDELSVENDRANLALEELAKKNVRIAIDDFGTAHSSFQRLAQLDLIEILKLDRSLLPGNQVSRTQYKSLEICKSLIKLAHVLDLKVVAEGLETVEQVNAMRAIGCDYGQGYFLGKPLPPSEIEKAFFTNAG